MKLFPKDRVVGIFRGFSEGGLEFHADLVLPYKNEFQSTPMHGQFLLVQLEHEDEAVLGRISSVSAQGRLASGSGEDYSIRAMSEDRVVPEDLREQYLKYQIDIRVLGVLRIVDGKLEYAASHRRLPHVGSKVAFLADDVLKEVSGHNNDGAEIGFYALGEFIFSGADTRLDRKAWMQVKMPCIVPRFRADQLVARRSFVFARAGFGKSNLVKLLFSNLYKSDPTVEKRKGRKVQVGTLIFDPDGEYFWPDDKNRPGLCDVPELQDKVVVFTKKDAPSEFYRSFVAGPIRLDIRRLRPSDVISIALSPERQEQQNVRKLKGLNDADWRRLVDEIHRHKNATDEKIIQNILHLKDSQEAETVAARANMTQIVNMLHDPSSQMLDVLLAALKAGKLCVVDVSQMRGAPALVLSGLILQHIFDHNQNEFTKANPQTIPTIAVIEEAQSVLGNTGGSSGEGPYVSWVKEGRKYDLGAVLITQQPGSIPHEILSQGDNWFIFHLLSAGDLMSVKKANAHFSDDLLGALLNEPIPGHGVYWSSAGSKSYPVPLRVLSFEQAYKARDPEYDKPYVKTYASTLRERFREAVGIAPVAVDLGDMAPLPAADMDATSTEAMPEVHEPVAAIDALESYITSAIAAVKADTKLVEKLQSTAGAPWMAVQMKLKESLPSVLDESERDKMALANVSRAVNEVLGKGKWQKMKKMNARGTNEVTYLVPKTDDLFATPAE